MRLQPLIRQHRRLFSRFHPLPLLQAALCLLCITVKTTQAADAAWIGGIGTQNWADDANWNPAAPGATSGTTNTNIATFNTGLGATTITVDAGRNLRSLVFATGAAGSFTIGSAGGNAGETLHLSSGGTIVMNSGITAPVTLNAPIVVHPTSGTSAGSYTFANNATSGDTDTNAYKLTINGNVSGGLTSGTITLNFNATSGNRSNDASANVMNGLISNGQAAQVAVAVAGVPGGQRGVWRFNNNDNSYTGATSVTNGTLIFTSIANSGVNSAIGAGTTLNVGGGSHVKYVGGAASTDRAITGNGLFYNNGSGALTLNGTIAAGLTFRGNQHFVVNGLISGSSGVSRTDGGTVFLNNNANSFVGDLAISDGAFRAGTISNNGTNSAVGNTGRIVLGQGSATIGRFEYTGVSTSTNRLILMRNDATGNTGRGVIEVLTVGETLTFTNGVRTNSSTENRVAELTLRGAGNGEIQGQIGGTTGNAAALSSLQIVKTGTGTWTLSGANTYTRLTTVSAGILNIRHSSALGAVLSNEAIPSAANAGTTVASGATLQLQNNISVGAEALSLAGSGASGQNGALVNISGTNSFAGAITLTADSTLASDSGRLNLTSTAAVAGSGGNRSLTLTGAGDGSLAGSLAATITTLTKNGAGLWTLSGANAHTGATTVNAGTLNVTGTLGTGNVSVNNSATFAHAGSLAGALTVANGATLIIGDAETVGSTGTLTVGGNLTLNNTSMLRFDLGTSSDLIQANGGSIILDGVVSITAGAGFTAGTYKLIGYTGTLTDNGLISQMLAGYDLTIAVDTVNQEVNLIATGINAQYWDGTDTTADGLVDGGNGVWTNAATNWTLADGSNNTSWAASVEKIAIFGGATGGIVQVQDSVAVNGLQFAKSYALTSAGGQIQITSAATELRVDPAVTATIATPVTGAGGINKTGEGTLVFTAAAGSNTYSGTTLISAGVLKIGATNTLPTNTAVTLGSGAFTAHLDLSEASQQIASLQVASNNANFDSTVTIGAGQMLTVNGTGGLRIGIANTVKTQTRAIFTGPGSLVVDNTSAVFESGLQTATTLIDGATSPFDSAANSNTVTSDFSGLGSFSANVNEFRVAQGLNVTSTLTLSNISNTITANTVNVANSGNWNSGTGTMILGAGVNTISANALFIGVGKGVGTLRFASQTAGSPGTVIIGGKTTAKINITVGSSLTTSTGASPTGTLDLRGHMATVTAGSLIIGKRSSGGNGGTTGTVYFDGGAFSADTVEIGTMSGNAGSSSPGPTASGQLIISGGTFTVNSGGSFTLATYANTNTFGIASGTLTLTGGTLISNVDILEGGGAGTTLTNTVSTINLNGGTLDMTGHHIGSATNTINNLNLAAGTLKDVGEINGGAAITKTTTGTLILQGDAGYTGTTSVSAGTLLVSNNPSGTGSATGTNDVSVSSGATFGGNGRVAGNVTLVAGATLAPGGNAASIAANATGLGTDTGTLRIAGNLDVAAASTLAFQVTTAGTHGLTATFDPVTNRLTSVSGTSTDGGNDRLIISGTFGLDAASAITVTLGSGFSGGYQSVFDLIDWSGADISLAYYDDGDGIRAGGSTDNALFALDLPDLTALNSSWFWDVSQFGSTGVIAIVPEPGRGMLLLAGLVTLILRRRSRR
jgi:autotransporter-associated beta strand protein